MVRICSVRRCNSQYITRGPISFHLFPSDPIRKNLWIKAVEDAGKADWHFIPGKYSSVCSKHFTEDCFNMFGVAGLLKTRTLKPDAIPTIFCSSPPNTDNLSEDDEIEIKEYNGDDPRDSSIIHLGGDLPVGTGRFSSINGSYMSQTEVLPENEEIKTVNTLQIKSEPLELIDLTVEESPAATSNLKTEIALKFVPPDSLRKTKSTEQRECSSTPPSKRRFVEPRYVGDLNPSSISNPREARIALRLVRDKIRKEQMKNHALEEEIKILEKRSIYLEEIVSSLKNNYAKAGYSDTITLAVLK